MDKHTEMVLKLMQGGVAALIGRKDFPLAITKVDVPVDENGDYVDHIEVTLSSGRKVWVLFTAFDPDES